MSDTAKKSSLKISKEDLKKESEKFTDLPFWNTYFYSSGLLKKRMEEIIPSYLENGRKYKVLDYGCGVRPYEYIFEKFTDTYTGIDVGENPHADVKIEPDEKLPFGDGEFDVVLSSQVLEHVENTVLYLSECRRVLKQGGLLFLSTHGTWQFHSAPIDVQRWTSYGLKKLIQDHGFTLKGFTPALGQLALTSQLRLTFYHSFVSEVAKPLKWFYHPISALYQLKMFLEDAVTPQRVKDRDSAYYLVTAVKN
ncbi:MAG TPA: class I SAM-dependent methyltransferase [Ignavibacteria bacterium]|nr:class I SAM-dependent methyltransferase [Ignavibacteria bacterium]HRK00314.1 class I SAM-dependent methyltransferase [Ignavibacteria bacterium]